MWIHQQFCAQYFKQILAMTKEQYGEENDIAQEDFLQHQYFKNPAGDALINLAVNPETDELAGQYIVLPMRYMINGQMTKVVCSLNTLTRQAYRGQGIFTQLAEITYNQAYDTGYVFCYGMPNQNSYPGFIKKLAFKEIDEVPLMLRPLCPSQMAAEYLKKPVLNTVLKPANCLFRLSERKSDLQFCPVTEENLDLMDEFWKAVCGKYNIMNVRDRAYIKFRYLDMPRRKYYPYVAIHEGKPVCFVVGRMMEVAGMQCAMLADFLFQDGFEEDAQALVRHVLAQLRKRGASLAGCLMLEHTHEYRLLKKLGFMRCPKRLEPQPFPLLVRRFDDKMQYDKLLDCRNWFFTMGDYDVI